MHAHFQIQDMNNVHVHAEITFKGTFVTFCPLEPSPLVALTLILEFSLILIVSPQNLRNSECGP